MARLFPARYDPIASGMPRTLRRRRAEHGEAVRGFVGRIVAVAALVAVGVVRAQAQDPPRVEIAFETGYTASEESDLVGANHRRAGLQRSRHQERREFRVPGGCLRDTQCRVEFLWNRQFSQFDASNPAPSQLLADVSVDNYHGNFVYNWFESDAKVRPFLFGGIGATHYSPGDPVSLPKVTSATGIDSATKFSFTWGGGVKLYPTPHFGVRLSARWTPTYIKSDAGGIWCDPYYGPCWVLADPDYSNQFAINGGVTFKFD
jgi:opacity protein-like surface antigen